jgi:2-oxoglutarate ferredoxin oxidoreductase subunit alpha
MDKGNSKNVKILPGNEAVADGAIAAGCRFFSGYPITPATEVAEALAAKLPKNNGVFMQMEDEISSVCTAIGASFGGMLACTASSGPGITLMQEGVGYAATVEAPLVVINVMRAGPSTGMPTAAAQQDIYQAKYGSHGDYQIIALMPSTCQEAFELTYKAFELSQKYRVPVYVLTDEIIGHTREKVHFPENLKPVERIKPELTDNYMPYKAGKDGLLKGMPAFNEGYKLLVDGQLHKEDGNRAGHLADVSDLLTRRLSNKITDHADDLYDCEDYFLEDADVVVISFGSPARPAIRAVKELREQGKKVGCLKIRTIWPFPEKKVAELAKKAHTLIVPEMNMGQVTLEVERVAAGQAKVFSMSLLGGLLHTPQDIMTEIEKRMVK